MPESFANSQHTDKKGIRFFKGLLLAWTEQRGTVLNKLSLWNTLRLERIDNTSLEEGL